MTEKKRSYGRTRSGVKLTDEVLERMAGEAEKGFELSGLAPHGRGRPPIGSAPAEGLPVRFEPELRMAINKRAKVDGVSAGEVVRRAVRKYLRSA